MQPKAIRNHMMVRGNDGLLRLEMVEAGRECVLDPLAELIWDLCDGSRSVEVLAQAAGRAFDREVPREEVFSALDFLADAGLIEERVAPPVAEANVSRRSLLARIAPVVGAAAWVMSGIPARAGGFIQYNESASKESDRKASDREYNNKESGRKASDREYNDKESGRKASDHESDNKERDNKNHDRETDDKRDWNKQQDAEKGRKRDFKKTMDDINASEIRREQLQRKMKASWPKVYQIVGHKLSEFPELQQIWEKKKVDALRWNNQTLTANNYAGLFKSTQDLFYLQVRVFSLEGRTRFAKAGFDLPAPTGESKNYGPVLAGDSQGKTYLVLDQVAYPGIGDNWRYALNADNLQFKFYDTEAAYQFLSNRSATGMPAK